VIHSATISNGASLYVWEPEDATVVSVWIALAIGQKNKKGTDQFFIRIATPEGFQLHKPDDELLIARPLIVLHRYDFHLLWDWLEKTVASCEDVSWLLCVEKLRRYFNWEYDDYKTE
jgi:Immunity protein 8